MSKTKKSGYSEEDVEVLIGLDGVRRKPSMYLGALGDPMYFTMVREVVDNAVDEFLAGRNAFVMLVLNKETDEVIVADKGEGIPVGIHKTTKVSTLTSVFQNLHGGAKMGRSKSHKVSGGTHGVGASAVNAVSKFFQVWTFREGKWWFQRFENSKPIGKAAPKKLDSKVVKALGYKPKLGTIVHFKPDQEIIQHKKPAKISYKECVQWFSAKAALNPGLRMVVKSGDKSKEFFNKDLRPLIQNSLESNGATPDGKPILETGKNFTLALQWSSYENDDAFYSYVSSINTIDHGEHEVGFRSALNKALAPYKKGKESWSPKFVYCGLIGHFDWKMGNAGFSSQTKEKLISDVSGEVEETLFPVFEKFFKKNPKVARKIIKRALLLKKVKEEYANAMKAIGKAKKTRADGVPPTIHVSCPMCKPDKRELFIVEGDSAMGGSKKARFKDFQEVMRLDGKIMNAARNKPAKVLGSEDIQHILTAIGFDFNALKNGTDPTHKLRVKSIHWLSDADVDGGHINVLGLTLLYKFIPRLFEEGRVEVVDAPLFSAYFKGNRYYGKTFKEVASQLPKGADKKIIVRSKGWGEIGVETLRSVAFDPKTRKAFKILPVKGKSGKVFENLVGSDALARKELLGLN